MANTPDRILATHVGSLVRPPKLVEFLQLTENGRPYDRAAFEACLTESVAELVRQQAEAGVDIVSDGEFGKDVNWAFYIHQRVSGFQARPATPAEEKDPQVTLGFRGRDQAAFPEFYAEYFPTQNFKMPPVPMTNVCNGPIRYTGQAKLQRDITNLKAAAAAVKVAGAFLPVVAPASAFPVFKNEYYLDDRAMLFALAEALHEEYRAIIDAGLILQIDDAFLPYMYERLVPPMTLTQYREWAAVRIDALNHALDGIPEERARYHICWGSWNAPHTYDLPLKDIVDLVLKVRVGAYLFEAANARHEHEWRVWEKVKLAPGKILIPGVIAHTTNVVEHPELVAERLVRLAKIVGRENVMGGTDCGFAQGPFTRRVHPSIQWAKLRALADGVRLASRELWGNAN
ncbi:MAG: cobalamin-independent methionine synthase II family protein [Candidatus Binataceae bacterium]